MYILWILAIWSHRQMMGNHSAKLRKYSNAVSCAKTGVNCVQKWQSCQRCEPYLAARQAINHGNHLTCPQTGAQRKTGKYKGSRALLETHTSLFYIRKILSFFFSSRKESGLTDAISKYWQKPPAPRSGSQPVRRKWAPLNLIFLNFFGLSQGWRTFLRSRDQTVDNFRRNSLPCGNLS